MNNYEKNIPRSFYIKKNFSWQLVQNSVAVIFPFIIRTLFVYIIGDELLGFNSLCLSIINTLNVANFGIDSVLIGRMYRPVETGDTAEVCRQLKLCQTIYRIIGLVILVGGFTVLPFLGYFIEGDVPNVNIYFVFTIYVITTVLSYWLFGYYLVVFKATQQLYYLNKNMTIGFLLQYGLQVLALLMHSYYIYICFVPISSIFYNISTYRKLRKEYPQYFCEGKTDKTTIRTLQNDVLSCAIYRVRDASRDTLDSIIISAVLGLVILSNYQNYLTVFLVPLILRTVITGTITPSLGNFNVTASRKEQYDMVKILWLLEIAVSGFFSICYFQLITEFISIWLGKSHVLQLSVALILSVYLFSLGICDFFKMIRQTNQLWEQGRRVAVIEMMVNLILNIVLAKWLGVFGIVLATVITIIAIQLPYELWLIVKFFFGQDVKRFLWLIIKVVVWMVTTNAIVWYIVNMISYDKYVLLIIQAIISVAVAGMLFILFFHTDEEWKTLLRIVFREKKFRYKK